MAEKTKLVFYFCTCLQLFFHTLIFITPLIFIFYIVLYLLFHFLALSFQYMCILLSSFSISLSWSSIWQKTRGLVSQKVQLSLSLFGSLYKLPQFSAFITNPHKKKKGRGVGGWVLMGG